MSASPPLPRVINLALQGGGAHGAFTWGVLDALLEDGRVNFEGVSASSAGAMNAVVMAHGILEGGRDGAREALERFWTAVADSAPFASALQADIQKAGLAPAMRMMAQWSHYLSPDQINPLAINPLKHLLSAQIDFARLRANSPVKLFIAATHANSGKLRLFRQSEMNVDVLLASSCLPTVHRAVEIDGEPYWDGAYAANPAVFPLFFECDNTDIMLVLLSPLKYEETPHTAKAIQERILELAFNATFLREMRMFAHLDEVISQSGTPLGKFERRATRTHFHVIDAEEFLGTLRPDTKLSANMRLFEILRDFGRKRTLAWLDTHFTDIGKRSTVRMAELFY